MTYIPEKLRPILARAIPNPVSSDGLVGYDEQNHFKIAALLSDEEITVTGCWDLRGKLCPLCTKAWTSDAASLADQHYSDLTKQHVHLSCLKRATSFQDRQELVDWMALAWMFHESGYRPQDTTSSQEPDNVYYSLAEIPNGYSLPNDPWARPWYKLGIVGKQPLEIVFGRRRSVWSLEFKHLTQKQLNELEAAFTDVGDTKGRESDSYYLHAWSDRQAVRYLRTFRTICCGAIGERGQKVIKRRELKLLGPHITHDTVEALEKMLNFVINAPESLTRISTPTAKLVKDFVESLKVGD